MFAFASANIYIYLINAKGLLIKITIFFNFIKTKFRKAFIIKTLIKNSLENIVAVGEQHQGNQYEKTNRNLINLLLLKNREGKNVLDLAIDKSSSRCVNLILSKLGALFILKK